MPIMPITLKPILKLPLNHQSDKCLNIVLTLQGKCYKIETISVGGNSDVIEFSDLNTPQNTHITEALNKLGIRVVNGHDGVGVDDFPPRSDAMCGVFTLSEKLSSYLEMHFKNFNMLDVSWYHTNESQILTIVQAQGAKVAEKQITTVNNLSTFLDLRDEQLLHVKKIQIGIKQVTEGQFVFRESILGVDKITQKNLLSSKIFRICDQLKKCTHLEDVHLGYMDITPEIATEISPKIGLLVEALDGLQNVKIYFFVDVV